MRGVRGVGVPRKADAMDTELDGLSPEARVARYRSFSLVALQQAQATKSEEMREAFLDVARGWTQLADHLEAPLPK